MPAAVEHLLDWFFELAAAERLSCTEIAAWSGLTGRTLRVWEVKTLLAMDLARQGWINDRHRTAGA